MLYMSGKPFLLKGFPPKCAERDLNPQSLKARGLQPRPLPITVYRRMKLFAHQLAQITIRVIGCE